MSDDLPSEDALALRAIFSPHERDRRDALLRNGRKLVHYTSAANAVSIIRSNRVWMRNARCMNDYMEVEHGIQVMMRSIRKPVDTTREEGLFVLMQALDALFPGLPKETIDLFDSWLPKMRGQTYVTSLSEHDPSENDIGRLSMWRSYTSSQVGVGLVIDPAPLYSLSDKFGAFSSPVFYHTEDEFRAMFLSIAAEVTAKSNQLEAAGRQHVKGSLFSMLRSVAMCAKHPGFKEEQEWRIMHTEELDELGSLSSEVECVGGIPQPVYKIHLEDHEPSGLTGITVPKLIQRVIIGPTQFPMVVYDAIIRELTDAKVPDPHSKVVYSNIPLRT